MAPQTYPRRIHADAAPATTPTASFLCGRRAAMAVGSGNAGSNGAGGKGGAGSATSTIIAIQGSSIATGQGGAGGGAEGRDNTGRRWGGTGVGHGIGWLIRRRRHDHRGHWRWRDRRHRRVPSSAAGGAGDQHFERPNQCGDRGDHAAARSRSTRIPPTAATAASVTAASPAPRVRRRRPSTLTIPRARTPAHRSPPICRPRAGSAARPCRRNEAASTRAAPASAPHAG